MVLHNKCTLISKTTLVVICVTLLTSAFLWEKILHYSQMYYIIGSELDSSTKTTERTFVLEKKKLVSSINCIKLFEHDEVEIKMANKLENDFLNGFTPDFYLQTLQNCSQFKLDRQYLTFNLSKEELEFPIAYSIVMYKAVNQFERLLRAIYRPQNIYCIHADTKMSDVNQKVVSSIANCFDNVFLSSVSYDIRWGKMTVLTADLACMKDLLRYKKWKYFINLTGQDFPLKTNLEIVRILKALKGANDVLIGSRDIRRRWKHAGTPPDGLVPYKGSVHVIVNRDFVEYAITSNTSIHLLEWLNNTIIPDESFFTILNHNPQLGIPGSFNGSVKKKRKLSRKSASISRFKIWHRDKDFKCSGKYVHSICIPAISELAVLGKRPELFVNKLYWDYNHYVMDCLEELLYNRTVDGFNGKQTLKTSRYSRLYFVRHAVK